MKLITFLCTIAILFSTISLFSQTPYSINQYDDNQEKVGGFGAYSPYMGLKVNAFGSNNELSDNFLIGLTPTWDIKVTDEFHLPIFSSFSFSEAINLSNLDSLVSVFKSSFLSENGITVGLFPYYILIKKSDIKPDYLVAHVEGSMKWNGIENEIDKVEYLRNFRFSFGGEYGIKVWDDYYLSLSATYTIANFDEEQVQSLLDKNLRTLNGLELSLAIPLPKSVIQIADRPIAIGLEYLSNNVTKNTYGIGIIAPINIKLGPKKPSSEENDDLSHLNNGKS